MTEPSAAAKAGAFANGLRKTVAAGGRRWKTWSGGVQQLAAVIASIDGIHARLAAAPDDPAVAACVADLRAVLEWSTYQSAALAAARAVVNARRTRTLSRRLGLPEDVAALRSLTEAEASLIESVRTRNGFMSAIADRHAHLGLPRPLVSADGLKVRPEAPTSRLALIRKIKQIVDR